MIICLKYEKKLLVKQVRWYSLVECEDCKTQRIFLKHHAVQKTNHRCRSCSNKGINNPNFGKYGKDNPRFGCRHSKESILKFREINSGENNPYYGKKHSEESKKKISIAIKGKYGGKQSHRWRHDLTQEERELSKDRGLNPKNRDWRMSVFCRDDFTCQLTGCNKGNKLNAHHIYSWADYPDKRFDINNGITICEDVHKLFHKIYGFKHSTPEQFEEFKLYILEVLELKV